MNISLCIITYNEVEGVKRAISSLKDLAHEVVIIDQGSEENNVKELSSLANVYVRTTRKGNADFDRNYGISIASGDFIFFLDSDEYIEDSERGKLGKILELNGDVYWFKFKNIVSYNGKEYDLVKLLGEDPHPRLFRKFIKLPDNRIIPTIVYDNNLLHRYPQINTMNQVFTGIYITHYRDLDTLIKTHIVRFNIGDEVSRNMERRFLNDLFSLINFKDHKNYPELKRILQ